jgi:hypothetical protein
MLILAKFFSLILPVMLYLRFVMLILSLFLSLILPVMFFLRFAMLISILSFFGMLRWTRCTVSAWKLFCRSLGLPGTRRRYSALCPRPQPGPRPNEHLPGGS